MKHGFNLYLRAVSHLFDHFWTALKTTGPAWIILTALTTLAAFLIVGSAVSPADNAQDGTGFSLPPSFWTYFLISQCLNFLTLGYIGPKFHRATLRSDRSDQPLPFGDYLFGLMQIGLIGLGLAFLASRLIAQISNTLPGPLGEITVPALFVLLILYVLLRFSVILPAVALSRDKTLHEAWVATHPNRYALFASLVLLLLTVGGLHSVALIWKDIAWLSLILGTIASWFALMVLLSYLNVIYRETRRHTARTAQTT